MVENVVIISHMTDDETRRSNMKEEKPMLTYEEAMCIINQYY